MNSTTNTFTMSQPAKERGWCEREGIAHSWQDGPTLTVNPPIRTRSCVNCGKRQHFAPGSWVDQDEIASTTATTKKPKQK